MCSCGSPNAPFGLELSEFNDIESRSLRPMFGNPGATTLIFRSGGGSNSGHDGNRKVEEALPRDVLLVSQ